MSMISVLSQETIDKIAAGEVVERPSSVVKELAENAIDAGATAVTVEIRDGGTSLIRITDNGSGMAPEDVPTAFLRHATSKIRTLEDLQTADTLGFRGEALSSIAAVAQVELITKTPESLTGVRYLIDGGVQKGMEEIGAPAGTTFLVRNMFYNTPVRKKFLRANVTEAGYISDLMERLALSHPEISFKFMNQGQTKLHTSGNGRLKDIIYGIYGRDVSANLLPVDADGGFFRITGFIGKPLISRSNRNYENYFVNGRYVKSSVIAKAIEEAYRPYMMNHRYPFTVLMLSMDGKYLDVNVHPTKMEVRFSDQMSVYEQILHVIKDILEGRELIPEVQPGRIKERDSEGGKPAAQGQTAEKEKDRNKNLLWNGKEEDLSQDAGRSGQMKDERTDTGDALSAAVTGDRRKEKVSYPEPFEEVRRSMIAEKSEDTDYDSQKAVQMDLFGDRLLNRENVKEHKLIGQVFDTYWLVEFRDKLYIIDQHAAHEKVLYERFLKQLQEKQQTSQMLSPPLILSLSMQEETILRKYMDNFTAVGFEIEPFGGREYSIRAVPGNLYGITDRELFLEMIDELGDVPDRSVAQSVSDKIALMSCKAAVKGNNRLSAQEADQLIGELLNLENPYNCPHGRPTIIAMSKYELERKFKRIL